MALRFSLCRLLCFAVLVSAGCTPGGQFTFYHKGHHELIDEAVHLREMSEAPAGIGRELDKHEADEYRVEPGDVLLVQPAEMGSTLRLPGDQPVLPDGFIRLGQLGKVQVMNRTVEEIQGEINKLALANNIKERIIVRVVSRDSKVYYVLGEVNAPGAFQLRGRETVLDAIVSAGGLNSKACSGKIILTRPTGPDSCRVVLPVEYNQIVQVGDSTTNYQVRAGDRIFVPSKSWSDDMHWMFGGSKPGKSWHSVVPCYPRGGQPCSEPSH